MSEKSCNFVAEYGNMSHKTVTRGTMAATQLPNERAIFTPFQLDILALTAKIQDETEQRDIYNLISEYLLQKSLDGVDKLWEEGKIDEQVVEQWGEEHMRTPYL